jgi:transketolase
MRKAFVQTLIEIAENDPRVVLLTADLGFMVLEPFIEKFPDRFLNAGVAEQNMIGVATGLAEAGYIPFVYSIVTFVTLRPFEFIRNGPVQHRLPVRIIGVGGGVEYGTAGSSHHGFEDVGVMRTQLDLTIIAPADPAQARTAFLASWGLPGPVYYRLGKDDKVVIPHLDGRFRLNHIEVIRQGSDLAIVCMGPIATEGFAAAEELSKHGIQASVIVVASVNPPPNDDLVSVLQTYPVVMTVEAHSINGGIGSVVAEVVAEHQLNCKVVRCGVTSILNGRSGSQDYLYRQYKIDRDALAERALIALSGEVRTTKVAPQKRVAIRK